MKLSTDNTSNKKYSVEKLAKVRVRIENVMVKQKKFRNRKYSFRTLVNEVDAPASLISAAIKEQNHSSFGAFVTACRLEDAKEIMDNRRFLNMSLSEVSEKVGFDSPENMNSAFYEYYGETVLEYALDRTYDLSGSKRSIILKRR
jgi:AraC-like DNA-binding protein